MTGDTITEPGTPTTGSVLALSVTESRAARELELRHGEFELAVQLGRIRTFTAPVRGPEPPGGAGPRRRVARAEIDRLRAAEGFPEALRASVRTDSAMQAARLIGITPARFTRLARLGLLVPVKFYVNRYRTVVWLYLAEELREFAAAKDNKTLLTDRLPETMRAQLDTGTDLRARNWRGRYAGSLLRLAEGPWARTAVTASLLSEDEVADVVDDLYERAYLAWLSPPLPTSGPPGSLAAQVVDELVKASDPDEIDWLRASLSLGLAEARRERPAPRFAADALLPRGLDRVLVRSGGPGVDHGQEQTPVEPPARPKGLLARLRRGRV